MKLTGPSQIVSTHITSKSSEVILREYEYKILGHKYVFDHEVGGISSDQQLVQRFLMISIYFSY